MRRTPDCVCGWLWSINKHSAKEQPQCHQYSHILKLRTETAQPQQHHHLLRPSDTPDTLNSQKFISTPPLDPCCRHPCALVLDRGPKMAPGSELGLLVAFASITVATHPRWLWTNWSWPGRWALVPGLLHCLLFLCGVGWYVLVNRAAPEPYLVSGQRSDGHLLRCDETTY